MVHILSHVIRFAEDSLKGFETIHGLKHARITAQYAAVLAKNENIDRKLCIISAWLHDIGRSHKWIYETKEHNHGIRSAYIARDFLTSLGANETEIYTVCSAISSHCFHGMQKTQTSKILWDADKLNLFSKKMEKDYIDYWTARLEDKFLAEKQLRIERGFYIRHFNTKTAVMIATAGIAQTF